MENKENKEEIKVAASPQSFFFRFFSIFLFPSLPIFFFQKPSLFALLHSLFCFHTLFSFLHFPYFNMEWNLKLNKKNEKEKKEIFVFYNLENFISFLCTSSSFIRFKRNHPLPTPSLLHPSVPFILWNVVISSIIG